MRAPAKAARRTDTWKPILDPEGRYSSGIPDFDRLLRGGFQRGSLALFSMDETVGTEDLDLLLFPTYLNMLYQSRGIMAILPARDSPHAFRARLTRYLTRRRFDTRVRVMDYVGEDEGLSYVVSMNPGVPNDAVRRTKAGTAKVIAAERLVRGNRGKSIVELTAFEVFETLLGADQALRLFLYGVKRSRMMGNLSIGLLGPGLACAAGVRRMADTEFALHRNDVGLIIRGARPAFSGHVVTSDSRAGPPHVALVPQPS